MKKLIKKTARVRPNNAKPSHQNDVLIGMSVVYKSDSGNSVPGTILFDVCKLFTILTSCFCRYSRLLFVC